MPRLPSGTVVFLFTDIEGSTRRWDRDRVAMGAALARHDALLREAVASHGGQVFKTVGDAFCAAFPRAADALAAALAGQRALAAADWGETGPLRVRMALHVGAAEERDADYFGPALNRVARLLAAGHGGQVLLSQAAEQLLRDDLPPELALRDLGEHRLKDLERPERIFQLVAPGLPGEFPPLATLDRVPQNLPVQPTPFVGREQEVARVVGLLRKDAVRLVTLTGPGGVGKTRLALQVAAELAESYPDGSWFVPLEDVTEGGRVAAAVAQVLGVREEPGRPPAEAVVEAVRTRMLLLDLDSVEQVVEEAGPFVARLLGASPRTRILATSRVRLGLRGEHEYQVPPLGLPPPGERDPEALLGHEAVRLFATRAEAARPGFVLSADNAPPVAQICRELDGLPLAIELAATRVKLFPPRTLLAQLQDRLGTLVGGERDRPARHRTLRGAVAWSFGLLSPEEQTLFARLSVFAGGFDLAAATAVANPGGELDLLAALAALVDHSLVRAEEKGDGEARFGLLATIRDFARERLAAAGGGEAELTRMLHAEHYLALAEEADPQLTGREQAAWLARLAAEYDNLRAALAWAANSGESEVLLRLTAALERFWAVRGHFGEGRGWFARALAGAGGAPPALRAKVFKGAGALAHGQGDYAEARALHEQELVAFREAGDERGVAQALGNLGTVAVDQGDYGRATKLFERSLARFRRLDDRVAIARVLNWLGAGAFLRGDYRRAADLYEESLVLAKQLRNTQETALGLVNLGEARQYQGDLEEAALLFQQALPLFRELGDARHLALVLQGLGAVALARGDLAGARVHLGESLGLSRELGDKVALAWCLERFAAVAAAQGDPAWAARLLGAADALREAIGAARPAAYADDYDRVVGAASDLLGRDAFAAAWGAGRMLAPEDAVAEALAPPGEPGAEQRRPAATPG